MAVEPIHGVEFVRRVVAEGLRKVVDSEEERQAESVHHREMEQRERNLLVTTSCCGVAAWEACLARVRRAAGDHREEVALLAGLADLEGRYREVDRQSLP